MIDRLWGQGERINDAAVLLVSGLVGGVGGLVYTGGSGAKRFRPGNIGDADE